MSTEEQGQSGLGLEAQEAAVAKFCEANGWQVGSVLHDVVSGASGLDKRPALLKVIGRLSKGDLLVMAPAAPALAHSIAFLKEMAARRLEPPEMVKELFGRESSLMGHTQASFPMRTSCARS